MMDDLVKRLRNVSLNLGVPSTSTLDSGAIRQAADRIESLEDRVAKADALADAANYAKTEMQGAYSILDNYFSESEFELDQGLANSHAGLHVALHSLAIALAAYSERKDDG